MFLLSAGAWLQYPRVGSQQLNEETVCPPKQVKVRLCTDCINKEKETKLLRQVAVTGGKYII